MLFNDYFPYLQSIFLGLPKISNKWNAHQVRNSKRNIEYQIQAPILPDTDLIPPHYTRTSSIYIYIYIPLTTHLNQ